MRRIAIVGVGTFGFYVAKALSEQKQDVLAIDIDKEKIQRVSRFASQAVIADAVDKETLDALGIKEVDVAVVSMGERTDRSILATLHLKELGVRDIVVKAVSEDHGRILSMIGASEVIFPERDMALRVANRLSAPNLLDHLPLAPGYSIEEVIPRLSFIGKTLRDIDLRNNYGVQVIAVKELVPERLNMIPAGDFVVKDSDILIVMGKDEDLRRIARQ